MRKIITFSHYEIRTKNRLGEWVTQNTAKKLPFNYRRTKSLKMRPRFNRG